MSGNSGPGYRQNPEHRIALTRDAQRVRVVAAGQTIAESREAITLREATYPPVYYFPRKDVRMDALLRTDHQTYCPYKGEASYYSISAAGKTIENAVWSYEHPYDEVMEIREYLAFYPRKVDLIEAG
ncbi:MAG TPA: DUF427 domain-containing protein [Burkholderiales bacterium]|jgi:uncharacterized protein (DUF427 family)|nr:DUF427 domain-containing protein [Burkholderiales bacterium]